MNNTTAKQFLKTHQIESPQIERLLEDFADIKVSEMSKQETDTFTIEVKNIDCDFNYLRDKLDDINPSFTLDKDTFIYCSADMPTLVKLTKLRDSLKTKERHILVTKV